MNAITKLAASILWLACVAVTNAGEIVAFDTKAGVDAARQFWCDVDANGRIIRVDAYGISLKEFVQLTAAMAREEIQIIDCSDEPVSVVFRDFSFAEAVHRVLKPRGFEIVKGPDRRYIIRKTASVK